MYLNIPNINFSFELSDSDDERHEIWKQQRLKRGFDDSECYELGNIVLRFILPRFKQYTKLNEVFIKDKERIELENKLIDIMEKVIDDTNTDDEFDYLVENSGYIFGAWL